jgi:hypothetical protein
MNTQTVVRAWIFGVSLLAAGTACAGYTHYWNWKAEPDPKILGNCLSDMRRIIAARQAILNVYDVDVPDKVHFNGRADDAYEDFAFPREFPESIRAKMPKETRDFHFCKTMWKPYDEVVTACLIAARYHFPPDVLEISSDGEWPSDWAAGAALYSKVTGRAPPNPLSGIVALGAENNDRGVRQTETQNLPRHATWLLLLLAAGALLHLFRRR